MSKGRILIVDPDFDIRNMLKIYFTGQGYEVMIAENGASALATVSSDAKPDVVVMELKLPDDGYEVYKSITQINPRTRVIILSEPTPHYGKLTPFDLGVDYFVTKPFDIEELKLYISIAMPPPRQPLYRYDGITGLPKAGYIEDHLRKVTTGERVWSYLNIIVRNFGVYEEHYTREEVYAVIRKTAKILREVVAAVGTPQDFIGYLRQDEYLIVTHLSDIDPLLMTLTERFDKEITQNYSLVDWKQGYTLDGEEQIEFMSLAIGVISARTDTFTDIDNLMDKAERNRGYDRPPKKGDGILTEW